MNKTALITVFDEENGKMWEKVFYNSLSKFPHINLMDIFPITGETLAKYLKQDEHFFYRNKPTLMREYLAKGYEKVIVADIDQIVMGDWSDLLNMTGFDLAAPYNLNRVDPPKYGLVAISTIIPEEYLNAGFVVCTNPKVADFWYSLCNSPHFDRCRMKEQDLMNIMVSYNIIPKPLYLDEQNLRTGSQSWWGLKSKGEGFRMKVVDNKVILPKADDHYPDVDTEIKLFHVAGGKDKQFNFRTWFSEPVIERIEELIA